MSTMKESFYNSEKLNTSCVLSESLVLKEKHRKNTSCVIFPGEVFKKHTNPEIFKMFSFIANSETTKKLHTRMR